MGSCKEVNKIMIANNIHIEKFIDKEANKEVIWYVYLGSAE